MTDYSYDVLLRLSHLRSVCADGTMQDIDYDYDEVSNISKIVNYAGMLPTGLGGTYDSQFSYDNLYRLAYADGNWQGNNSLYYETSLEYEKNGRISRKVLYADTWLDGNYATENYDNRYYYANSSQPNTLSYINDTPQQSFGWDQKGNMVFHHNGHSGYDRKLCWDEQNRLLGVLDEGRQLSCYLYDANGDRTYKFTGEYTAQNQSGQWHYYYLVDQPTLYASPYLVANRKGYTKHYYAESERIASRIGGGGLQEIGRGKKEHMELFLSHQGRLGDLFETLASCLDAEVRTAEDALKGLYDWHDSVHEEKECYWYHPDHLGSSSWITFTDGKAVQHLHYLPWGEDYVNQRTTDFSARYTFSAKEKDPETGLSYFGSRYYSSDLSVWLSVDPMSDKYPNESPYVYCGNAPILLKDPNGREKINAFGKHNKTHSDASNRYKDNVPVIHLWAHGNNKMMQTFNPKTDEPQFVRNADDMHAFLCEHSDIYQSNSDNNKTSILVLHSCQTGKGENNIAQQLSSELDLLVVAPSEDVYNSTQNAGTAQEFTCEIGVNSIYTDKNGKTQVGKRGSWNIYYKGIMVDSFDGHTKPNFKDPQKIIDKYEKKYQKIMSTDQ